MIMIIYIRPISLLTLWISGVRLEHNLNLKGWDVHVPRDFLGIFPESLTQAMLVGTMLIGRLGVKNNWRRTSLLGKMTVSAILRKTSKKEMR